MTREDLEVVVARIDTRLARIEHELLGNGQPGRCAGHGSRIASLEQWRSAWTGAKVVLIVIGTAVISSGGSVLVAAILEK